MDVKVLWDLWHDATVLGYDIMVLGHDVNPDGGGWIWYWWGVNMELVEGQYEIQIAKTKYLTQSGTTKKSFKNVKYK